ncbi:bone morphogenetic protein 1-like [Branchiostoma lanceolatum]|uniref:bone morphogenetic protein 1-like n=1 Tax=Branchiostoma lanceolatum TaxID=7740 RepID=UPI00345162D0
MKQLFSAAALFLLLVTRTAAQTDCNVNAVLSVPEDGRPQEGVLATPQYGDVSATGYPNSLSCTWVITAPENHKITLVFRSPFGIEPHSSCSYDYLKIHDGADTSANLLGQVCGTSAPADIQGTGNELYLHFESDYSVNAAGFSLDWSTTCVDGTTSCDVAPVCFTPAQQCDSVQACQDFTDEEGCLATYGLDVCEEDIDASTAGGISQPTDSLPFFPPGATCGWNITAPSGSRLIFTATAGDIDCTTASVELTDNSTSRDLCNQTTTFIVHSNYANLTAVGPIPEDGFALAWVPCSADELLCEADLSCLPVEAICNGTTECSTGDDEDEDLCRVTTTTEPTTTEPPTTTVFSNVTVVTEDPGDLLSCYTCNGTSDCLNNPANVGSTACEDGEHCWVERVGEAGSSDGLTVMRGCGDACSDYWALEACETPQGRPKVCMKCCSEHHCNDFVLTGNNEARAEATATAPCLWLAALAALLASYFTNTLQ